jgi:hypothetical protein
MDRGRGVAEKAGATLIAVCSRGGRAKAGFQLTQAALNFP